MIPNAADVLAQLPDDAEVTVTVKLRDWIRAREATRGGPEYAAAGDVARVLGFSATYWSRRAREGKILGAVQDDSRRWRLPIEACREHIRGLSRKPSTHPARPALVSYRPRGPRKPYQAKEATPA